MQNRHIFSEQVSRLAPVRIGTTPESPFAVSLHARTLDESASKHPAFTTCVDFNASWFLNFS